MLYLTLGPLYFESTRVIYYSMQGYFRRAEALKAMLESPNKSTPPPGTYKNVVKDYLQSHAYQSNVDTFLNAVHVAIDEGEG